MDDARCKDESTVGRARLPTALEYFYRISMAVHAEMEATLTTALKYMDVLRI